MLVGQIQALNKTEGNTLPDTTDTPPLSEEEGGGSPHQLVIVHWIDVVKYAGWEPHEEVICPRLRSIGWLVDDTEYVIKIADTIDEEDGTGYGVMALPRGVVTNIEFL